MSWICPWCGAENDTEAPEGRQRAMCRYCEKEVPPRESWKSFKQEIIHKLEMEKWPHEQEVERIDQEIYDVKKADYDRPRVRVIAKDQTKLPFEVPA